MATFVSSSGSAVRSKSWGGTEEPSEYAMYFHLPALSIYMEEFTLQPWNSLSTHEGRGPLGDAWLSAFSRSSGIREYPLRFCGTGILAISKERYTKSKCYCSYHDLKSLTKFYRCLNVSFILIIKRALLIIILKYTIKITLRNFPRQAAHRLDQMYHLSV